MKQKAKISLLVLAFGLASMPALAQDTTTDTPTDTTTTGTTVTTQNDDDGMDWGWLGLLGLAGLAGLRRPAPTVVHRDQTTTQHR
ncbi:WGxxGxxG family protein [Deinococcus marmoris]|uniref:WGxxGxxG family protein n=1 Tax=Deinococcus marmoris TaxID=249408 RepID=UPI000495F641|nr:WGxxGxxG family protein [Deinococcus marmoris]